jgi:diguanylate cyclase (GGDEF)-like protein
MAWLAALTAAAFLVPILAWYRRTREKQQADRRIRFLAHHDALTGLANRPQLFEHLEHALIGVRPGNGLAAHFIDLDHFKEINDTLGHDGGDFLLKTIAERLRATVRQNDIVARLGGDEFVVIQLGVVGKDEAAQFAGRLTAALAKPMQFKDQQILPTMSVGVAVAPDDGHTSDRLLKSADLALYRSKADGRNCFRMFLPEMDSEVSARIELERIMRNAIAGEGFELHYLPLLAMPGRRLIGYEALTRLRGPNGSFIPPEVFVPVAEDIKLTAAIGAWALREACKFAATWPPHLRLMIKFSPALFAARGVGKLVGEALAHAGLDPPRLEVEVTETLLLGGGDAVVAELRALKATGVSIVLDDFGTGHSSLGYLWRFPFDKIKIDRSFMAGLDGSGRDAATVVKTISALARELNMRIAVEGVESSRQAAFLAHADGGEAQGFFFDTPLAAAEVAANVLAELTDAEPAREGPQVQGKISALQ